MTETTKYDGEQAAKNRKPSLIAYQVREVKYDDGRTDSFWDRVGVAWSNKDGGFTIQLHSVPLSGRIVLTKPKQNG
jgi:hypothetical protein